MIRKIFYLLAAVLIFAAIVAPVCGVNQAPDKGLNGKGKAEHLYLFEKDPADWTIVEGGAWGKMTYLAESGKFCFNGHNLTPEYNYALIYYPDPWPGMNLSVFGNSTADEYGDVHISGSFDFTIIPNEDDENFPYAKIWLILFDDQDGIQMTGWNPTEYLFEYNTVLF